MLLDADAYLRALEPPALRLGGKVHRGRLLSLEEWLPFEGQLQTFAAVLQGTEKQDEQQAAVREMYRIVQRFFEAVFPTPFWRLLLWWKPTVAEQVLALPPAAILKVTRSFFQSQAHALSVRLNMVEEEGSLRQAEE